MKTAPAPPPHPLPPVDARTDDPFIGIAVPPALQDSLARHRENLARLVGSLQVAGVDEARIEASVTLLVDSYKTELLGAIKSMLEQDFDRS